MNTKDQVTICGAPMAIIANNHWRIECEEALHGARPPFAFPWVSYLAGKELRIVIIPNPKYRKEERIP